MVNCRDQHDIEEDTQLSVLQRLPQKRYAQVHAIKVPPGIWKHDLESCPTRKASESHAPSWRNPHLGCCQRSSLQSKLIPRGVLRAFIKEAFLAGGFTHEDPHPDNVEL